MWCETQKNGTVKYCERYTDPLTEKVKKVTVTMPKASPQNKNKASRILNAKIDAALESTCIDKKITLSELHEAYHAAQCVTYKLSTTRRNYIIVNSVLNLLDSDAIVNNITAQYVNNRLLNSGKPISTLNTYITRFKAMLNWGYKNGVCDNYLKDKSRTVLNHQISPHKLRHTHASLLAANGMTPDQIARRLGHGRSDVTQDIYIHVTQQVVANDNKTIDSINLIS